MPDYDLAAEAEKVFLAIQRANVLGWPALEMLMNWRRELWRQRPDIKGGVIVNPSTPEEYRTSRMANIDKVLQEPLLLRWIRPENLRELQAERQAIATESAEEAARRFALYQQQPQKG